MGKVKIVLSEHVMEKKIPILRALGWKIDEIKIKDTVTNPKWKGTSPYNQPTAMSLINENYILRVVFNENDDIIFVVTVVVTRRGRYESTR